MIKPQAQAGVSQRLLGLAVDEVSLVGRESPEVGPNCVAQT